MSLNGSKTVNTVRSIEKTRRALGAAILALAVLAGCTANVRVDEQFPDVVSQPRDINAALVVDHTFRHFQAQPVENTIIQLGEAQVQLLTKAFKGLFQQVEVIDSKDQAGPGTDIVITPSVRDVQISVPSESYLNVYEVWIKYGLEIEAADGTAIDSWFLPAYGKTPDSYLLSRSKAIDEATVVALRDAGAKLILDFYRIPAFHGWWQQHQKLTEAGQ